MASEPAAAASERPSFIENLINSRNRDISLFLPFLLGLNASAENPGSPPDRIVLINPFTQGMVVFERSNSNINSNGNSNSSSEDNGSLGFESMLNELLSRKSGRPPASRAAIDALESVEAGDGDGDGDGDQCAICLEEWDSGEKAKRMPCKHLFHGECIEKWLNIHGTCPVCRHEMPVEEADDERKRGSGGVRRGDIWVSLTFSGERRSGERESDHDSSERNSNENVS